jgi:hypothetical protein
MKQAQSVIAKEDRRQAMTRRATVLKEVLESYINDLPFEQFIPSMGDIFDFPAFKNTVLNTPVNVELTADSFAEALSELPRLSKEWLAEKEKILLETLGPDFTHADLKLAATRFYCNACSRYIHYPRVLVHHCFKPYNRNPNGPHDSIALDVYRCRTILGTPWSPIKCEKAEDDPIAPLITQGGLDPKTATIEHLIASGLVFEAIHTETSLHEHRSYREIGNVSWVVCDSLQQ